MKNYFNSDAWANELYVEEYVRWNLGCLRQWFYRWYNFLDCIRNNQAKNREKGIVIKKNMLKTKMLDMLSIGMWSQLERQQVLGQKKNWDPYSENVSKLGNMTRTGPSDYENLEKRRSIITKKGQIWASKTSIHIVMYKEFWGQREGKSYNWSWV